MRCNGIQDCKDDSDESSCNIVKVKTDTYNKEYPAILNDRKITIVYVNISVLHIDNLEESDMTMSVKIMILLKWYDSRLTFYNLKAILKARQLQRAKHIRFSPFLLGIYVND
jgi:hypothetical protein